MRPVLNPEPDRLLSPNRLYLSGWSDVVLVQRSGATEPQRGQIVSLLSPVVPTRLLIKRVIGLDGDMVLPRAVALRKEAGYSPTPTDFVKIPQGHCWIEGDNAESSLDSNSFGPVPRALLTGIANWLLIPQSEGSPRRRPLSRLLSVPPDPSRLITTGPGVDRMPASKPK